MAPTPEEEEEDPAVVTESCLEAEPIANASLPIRERISVLRGVMPSSFRGTFEAFTSSVRKSLLLLDEEEDEKLLSPTAAPLAVIAALVDEVVVPPLTPDAEEEVKPLAMDTKGHAMMPLFARMKSNTWPSKGTPKPLLTDPWMSTGKYDSELMSTG
jgi:hypothetical protein